MNEPNWSNIDLKRDVWREIIGGKSFETLILELQTTYGTLAEWDSVALTLNGNPIPKW